MTAAERHRLAAILGMLGSDHAGERAAAALQAEAFRKRHKLTWEQMLALPALPMDQWVRPAWMPPEPRPAPPPPPKPDPYAHAPSWAKPNTRPPDPPPPKRERHILMDIYAVTAAVAVVVYFGAYALNYLH